MLLLLPQHCLKAIYDNFRELLGPLVKYYLVEISIFQTFSQKMSSGSAVMTALLLLPQHCLKATFDNFVELLGLLGQILPCGNIKFSHLHPKDNVGVL